MAVASDFKFGTQLGFAKTNHKITPTGKSGRGFGLGKLPNIWLALYYFCNGRAVLLALAELLVYYPTGNCYRNSVCLSVVCNVGAPYSAG